MCTLLHRQLSAGRARRVMHACVHAATCDPRHACGCGQCERMLFAGRHGIRMLDKEENLWDRSRGQGLARSDIPDAGDVSRLDVLVGMLTVSNWAPTTRGSYNRWFAAWLSFCLLHSIRPLPVEEAWFCRFLTYLACYYSKSTVSIAVASVVALSKHNGHKHPVKTSQKVQLLLHGIDRTGLAGLKAPKFIIDQQFVVKMCTVFLEHFPIFDASLFDPNVHQSGPFGKSIVLLRGVSMILLGLAAGLRAGEVGKLTVCCWQARLLESVYVHVKLAKNGRNGEESGAYLFRDTGRFVDNLSAIAFFEEFWFPFLKSQGIRQSRHCTHARYPASHCRECPPLFPTWPHNRASAMRAVTPSEVTSVVKQWATLIGLDPSKYSAISFRRGSVSVAAAAKVCRNIRQKHIRWKTKEMQDTYTEASVEEMLEFGRALQQSVRRTMQCQGKTVTFQS